MSWSLSITGVDRTRIRVVLLRVRRTPLEETRLLLTLHREIHHRATLVRAEAAVLQVLAKQRLLVLRTLDLRALAPRAQVVRAREDLAGTVPSVRLLVLLKPLLSGV